MWVNPIFRAVGGGGTQQVFYGEAPAGIVPAFLETMLNLLL